MGKKILLLGVTGVQKKQALRQLATFQTKKRGEKNFFEFHFEEILKEATNQNIYTYLNSEEVQQTRDWISGWQLFKEKLKACEEENPNKDIYLCMHGVLIHRFLSIRSPLVIESLMKDFSPDIIFNLINDVYLLWHQTETRAEGLNWRGRPELEHLLTARRGEVFLGDLLTKQLIHSKPIPIPHYMLSIWHPARVLDKIISNPDLKLYYFAHSISQVRRLIFNESDYSFYHELNGLFKEIIDFEKNNDSFSFFSPLTIDELPLVQSYDESGEGDNEVIFEMNRRWNIRDFVTPDEILLIDDSSLPEQIVIPKEQIKHAQGFIKSDVYKRDYRLVTQSNGLIALNPVPKGKNKLASGVNNELRYAPFKRNPCHIFQNNAYDTEGILEKELGVSSQNMGGLVAGGELWKIHQSMQDLLQAIIK